MENEKQNVLNTKRQEIINLRSELTSSVSDIGDYRIIKCYEAALAKKEAPYDADDLIAKRQAVRDKINALETELAKLEVELKE